MLRFQIGPRHFGYHLDRSEEIVLIDAWLKVKARIPAEERWQREFEDRFFGTDNGVSEHVLENIEKHLRRLRLRALDFRQSSSTPYMKIRRQEKVDVRRHIREDLETRSDCGEIIEVARAECLNLPPYVPKRAFDEDPIVGVQRRKEEALERARKEELAARDLLSERAQLEEKAARGAELARIQQEAAALENEIESTRGLVAAAELALQQPRTVEARLFGALEQLLLNVAGKLDVLVARSRLDGLRITDLARKFAALEGRLGEQTHGAPGGVPTTMAPLIAAGSPRANGGGEIQDNVEEEQPNGHGTWHRPRHEVSRNGQSQHNGHRFNGGGREGLEYEGMGYEGRGHRKTDSEGYDGDIVDCHGRNGHDKDDVIHSRPGGYYGDGRSM